MSSRRWADCKCVCDAKRTSRLYSRTLRVGCNRPCALCACKSRRMSPTSCRRSHILPRCTHPPALFSLLRWWDLPFRALRWVCPLAVHLLLLGIPLGGQGMSGMGARGMGSSVSATGSFWCRIWCRTKRTAMSTANATNMQHTQLRIQIRTRFHIHTLTFTHIRICTDSISLVRLILLWLFAFYYRFLIAANLQNSIPFNHIHKHRDDHRYRSENFKLYTLLLMPGFHWFEI